MDTIMDIPTTTVTHTSTREGITDGTTIIRMRTLCTITFILMTKVMTIATGINMAMATDTVTGTNMVMVMEIDMGINMKKSDLI